MILLGGPCDFIRGLFSLQVTCHLMSHKSLRLMSTVKITKV